ncbi:MAG: hypothetical protein QMC78_02270 [Methanocellales archaeon]|nr:hypothetical protein [Methanocellales archaeon]
MPDLGSKKLLIVIGAILILGSGTAGWLSHISVLTNKSEYSVGDGIDITIKNTGLWYTYGVPSIAVYDSEGNKIYEDVPFNFSGAFPSQIIATFYWIPSEKGTYKIVARIYIIRRGTEVSTGLGGLNRLEAETFVDVV